MNGCGGLIVAGGGAIPAQAEKADDLTLMRCWAGVGPWLGYLAV